jgi:hypothetical protein
MAKTTNGNGKEPRYSTVRYWRYVFTPLLLFGLFVGLYLLFQTPDAQTASYANMVSKTNSLVATGTVSSTAMGLSGILSNLQNLGLNPSAPPATA